MIAWDTNLLVRHLAEDDPDQTAQVREQLGKAKRAGELIYLSQLAITETAWVLQSGFSLRKQEVLFTLEDVTKDTRFLLEGGAVIPEAIKRARSKGDLPEHIIALSAKAAGARKTQTFDQALKRFPEFEIL